MNTNTYTPLVFLFVFFQLPLYGQFHPHLNDQAFELYPGLNEWYGYAVAEWGEKAVIFGGKIKSDNLEMYSDDYPNSEIIIIDYLNKEANAYSSYLLEGTLGEQMAGYGLAYYQQDSILYFMGGYAFNDSNQNFETYPYLSRMNIPLTIKALENGHPPGPYITQVCDQRMALFEAVIDYNGDEFFLLGGKNAGKRNALQENPMYYEENFEDEVRTFRIVDHHKYPRVENFKVWFDLQAFYEHYQDTTPEKIKRSMQDKAGIILN